MVTICDSSPSIFEAALKSIYVAGKLLLLSMSLICGKLFEGFDEEIGYLSTLPVVVASEPDCRKLHC